MPKSVIQSPQKKVVIAEQPYTPTATSDDSAESPLSVPPEEKIANYLTRLLLKGITRQEALKQTKKHYHKKGKLRSSFACSSHKSELLGEFCKRCNPDEQVICPLQEIARLIGEHRLQNASLDMDTIVAMVTLTLCNGVKDKPLPLAFACIKCKKGLKGYCKCSEINTSSALELFADTARKLFVDNNHEDRRKKEDTVRKYVEDLMAQGAPFASAALQAKIKFGKQEEYVCQQCLNVLGLCEEFCPSREPSVDVLAVPTKGGVEPLTFPGMDSTAPVPSQSSVATPIDVDSPTLTQVLHQETQMQKTSTEEKVGDVEMHSAEATGSGSAPVRNYAAHAGSQCDERRWLCPCVSGTMNLFSSTHCSSCGAEAPAVIHRGTAKANTVAWSEVAQGQKEPALSMEEAIASLRTLKKTLVRHTDEHLGLTTLLHRIPNPDGGFTLADEWAKGIPLEVLSTLQAKQKWIVDLAADDYLNTFDPGYYGKAKAPDGVYFTALQDSLLNMELLLKTTGRHGAYLNPNFNNLAQPGAQTVTKWADTVAEVLRKDKSVGNIWFLLPVNDPAATPENLTSVDARVCVSKLRPYIKHVTWFESIQFMGEKVNHDATSCSIAREQVAIPHPVAALLLDSDATTQGEYTTERPQLSDVPISLAEVLKDSGLPVAHEETIRIDVAFKQFGHKARAGDVDMFVRSLIPEVELPAAAIPLERYHPQGHAAAWSRFDWRLEQTMAARVLEALRGHEAFGKYIFAINTAKWDGIHESYFTVQNGESRGEARFMSQKIAERDALLSTVRTEGTTSESWAMLYAKKHLGSAAALKKVGELYGKTNVRQSSAMATDNQ